MNFYYAGHFIRISNGEVDVITRGGFPIILTIDHTDGGSKELGTTAGGTIV